jgi:hypothetical protein
MLRDKVVLRSDIVEDAAAFHLASMMALNLK